MKGILAAAAALSLLAGCTSPTPVVQNTIVAGVVSATADHRGVVTILTASGRIGTFAAGDVCGWRWVMVDDVERYTLRVSGTTRRVDGVRIRGLQCPQIRDSSNDGGRAPDTERLRSVDTSDKEEVRKDNTPSDSGKSGTDGGNDSPDRDKPGKPPKISG